jgi:hypothetical protein
MNGSMRVRALAPAAALLALLALVDGCNTTGSQANEEVWAIRCITLTGPDQFQQAEAYAEALKQVRGLDPQLVQVMSDEDGTAVYYGRYRREQEHDASVRFKPSQLEDLEIIRTLRFQGAQVWPFYLATMDVLPTYRSAHPEWNLATAAGYWSLHVAVFYDTETFRGRRSAAERYCEELRSQGVEAYYHHVAGRSSVYVGTYPEAAVVEVRRENPLRGEVEVTDRIVHPEMLAAQKRFPYSLHNGHKLYSIVRGPDGSIKERIPAPSFPVVMPGAEQSAGLERR